MVTLASAQMFYYFAISWPSYGGEDGLLTYVRDSFPGVKTRDPLAFFVICFALLAFGLLFSARITKARFCLALQGAQQYPKRLESFDIRPFWICIAAFVMSAMVTGLAGALYTDLNRFASAAALAVCSVRWRGRRYSSCLSIAAAMSASMSPRERWSRSWGGTAWARPQPFARSVGCFSKLGAI